MNTKSVVSKQLRAGRRATGTSSSVLAARLLVLLLVLATAACGRTAPQTVPSQPATAQQQTCVRVGQDACYTVVAGGRQPCVRVGHDACYLLSATK